MTKRFVIVLAVLLFQYTFYAQKAWTLDECVEYARLHSPGILSTRSQIDILHIQTDSPHSYQIPSVVSQIGYYRSMSDNPAQSFNYPYAYLFVNGAIYDGQQTANNSVQSNTAKSMEYSLEQALHDLSVQVSTLFLQTMYMAEQVKSIREQIDTTNFAASYEKLEMESSLADYESQHISLRLTLARLVGVPDPLQFNISISDDNTGLSAEQLDVPVPRLDDKSTESFPSVLAAQSLLEAGKSSLKLARSSKLPRFGWGVQVGSYYVDYFKRTDYQAVVGPFKNQIADHFIVLPQVFMIVPILNQGATKQARRQAEISILDSRAKLESAKKDLLVEAEKSYSQTLAAKAKYLAVLEKSRQENPVSAKTSFDLSYACYDYLIKRNILDYYLNK